MTRVRHLNLIAAILLFFGCLSASFSGEAHNIQIQQLSSLDFGTGVAGDPSRTIPPGSSENTQNASFLVSGQKESTYTILLPHHVNLTSDNGRGHMTLTSFTSFPSSGQGLLDSRGEQTLYVGATRSPLDWNQAAGNYVGTFLVIVVY